MIAHPLIERIQGQIQDDSDETLVDIKRHLNIEYMGLAGKHMFRTLMVEITGVGSVLPADLVRPFYVEDDINHLYFESGISSRYRTNRLYNWWINMTTGNPVATGSDGAIAANAVTLTSAGAAFTSALIGEYVQIGSNLGLYKITAVPTTKTLTLADGFRGATETAAYYQIRPEGTLSFFAHDHQGSEITSTTIKLWYLRRPLPIYNDYDNILLPGNCDALFIKVIQSMLKTGKYTNDALKEIQDFEIAWAEMCSLSPTPKQIHRSRDRLGRVQMFGRRRTLGSSDNFHDNDVL